MPELADLLPMLAFLIVIGAVSGVIAGLLGVGGGIVLVPAFFYTFSHLGFAGPDLMQICLATSLATIVATSARSMQAHGRRGAVDHALLRRWAPSIAVGAIAGMLAAAALRSSTLQLVFGVLALIAGLQLALSRPHWKLADQMPRGIRLHGYGAGLGFLSVLMGIGGGSFGVPIMTLHGMAVHRAIGTASGLGLIIAVPSVIGFLLLPTTDAPPWTVGAVNLPACILVVMVSLVTTPLGARLAHAMNPAPLKRIFAVFVLLVAANMLRKAAGF
jgi:uncharacterized protein